MKIFLKVIGVFFIPIGIGLITAAIAYLITNDDTIAKSYGNMYMGMSYAIYLYEIGFLKRHVKS